MHSPPAPDGRRRRTRAWPVLYAAVIALTCIGLAWAAPYVPVSDQQVLAELPAGARYSSTPARALAASRLDIALPLAQFDIARARATGDLRFLGYAEATLAPWMKRPTVAPQVLVLDATILQSRHAFAASLAELDQALKAKPDDPQAWLTRATVLRVLGRYDEALVSCEHLAMTAGSAITALCTQGLHGLMGHLNDAYAGVAAVPPQNLAVEARAWRYSELAEMAERLGNDAAAEQWFREGLQMAPQDLYMRTGCADLLLRLGRPAETLQLTAGHETMEPMLLRTVIAHRLLNDGAGSQGEALLLSAFDVEQRRGDAVHRREQARFLLDVTQQPAAALAAAEQNWQVQREPEDILILLRAARAARRPAAAVYVLQFVKQTGLEDMRLGPYRDSYRDAK